MLMFGIGFNDSVEALFIHEHVLINLHTAWLRHFNQCVCVCACALQVTLPVYLNFTRTDLIFTVDFDIASKEDPRHFYERGVAVLCTE